MLMHQTSEEEEKIIIIGKIMIHWVIITVKADHGVHNL
jgi:hypothetical protein